MTFKKIRFVTDSTSDIPAHIIEQQRIGIIPAYVNIGDESFADDGIQLNRSEYYDRLPTLNPFPTTAAAAPGVAREVIDAAFEDADHLFILMAPPKLSALYESARLGSLHLPQDRITLLESGSLSMAQGYQVIVGAEVAAETGDVDQVRDAIARVRKAVRLGALVHGLDNLRRSGRINPAAAGVGTLLQIKPMITVEDGVLDVISRLRTFKRAREGLIEYLRQQGPLDRLTFIHANNLEDIAVVREAISDILPETVHEVLVNPALGTHVGSGSIGFITLNKTWRL